MRLYRSRLRSSVPNQAFALGGELMNVVSVTGNRSVSPYRAGMLGKRHASTTMVRITSATIATQFRRNRPSARRNGERDSVLRPSDALTSSRPDRSAGVVGSKSVGSGVADRSVKTDPRVEVGVQNVGEQVRQDHAKDDEHHPRHELWEVSVLVGREEVVPHPAGLEDPLGDDEAADDRTKVDGGDRHDRDERVAEGVAYEDPALADPLGAP